MESLFCLLPSPLTFLTLQLMHPNSCSPALPHTHVCNRPNAQLYTSRRSLSTNQVTFININKSQTACFRCFAPPETQGSKSRNGTPFNCYQIKKIILDKNSLIYTLAFESQIFATDVNCLELCHLHLRKLANALSASCCNGFIVNWVLCTHLVTYSISYTSHIMIHDFEFSLRPCYNTVVIAIHTCTRLPFCTKSVSCKPSTFRLKFLRPHQRPQLIFVAVFVARKVSVQMLSLSFEGQKLKTKVKFRKNT